jgi:bifunctional non-homologous end joining protein LigD
VAEVAFTEWTSDGRLRHPSFRGLREDKLASEVVHERSSAPSSKAAAGKAKADARPSKTGTFRSRARATPRSTGTSASAPASTAGVTLTHPDRVLYPDQGLTKQDLADYYVAVAEAMLPHLAGRLLTLVRCPQGQGKHCFYQKHVGADAPPAIATVEVREADGAVEPYHYVNDLGGLISLVQLGVLEIHGWMARADDVEHPDRLVFDLDPDESLPWQAVVGGAREIRQRLADVGLESWPLSTGGKGLHVVAPLVRRRGWDEVREFARALATAMAGDAPSSYLSRASKAERKGRIFVDWLRNGRGASAIVPFSTRAKPGAPVATPLRWEEVARFRPGSSTALSVPKRLARSSEDPWDGFWKVSQALPAKPGQRGAPRRR